MEVPPTVSNLSYLLEDDELCKDGGLRTLLTQLLRSNKKSSWVNNSHGTGDRVMYETVEVKK